MNSPLKAVRSLVRVKLGRRTYYVLPFRGVAYGLASLAIVFGLLLAIDRLVLGSLERGGWTAGQQWALHNKIVEENHRRKTTTNECELRWWNGQPPRTDASHKILVMGDSFVWGPPYLTLNHLWWRQLAIELERRGYRDVEVVAVGHPGWSTHRQLECARKLIPEIKPDLVIWGYVTNDPDEKVVRQIFDSQDRPPYGQRIRNKLKWLLPNLTFKFESLRGEKLAAQYTGPDYGYAYSDWELKLLEGENFARYRQTVDQVGNFLRDSQIPTFLVTLPHFPGREYFEPRYAPVLPLWESAGVPVLNTLDEFVHRYGDAPSSGPESLKWGINPADSHPGPTATHFFATQAADYLEQMRPDVLGPKDPTQPHELVINDWLPFNLNVQQLSEQRFKLNYPKTTDLMPQIPLGEPTAIVALRYPQRLSEIRLQGLFLRGGRMWISILNANDGHDEHRWHEIGRAIGGTLSFSIPADLAAREVAEIRFGAEVEGTFRGLELTLIPPPAAEDCP